MNRKRTVAKFVPSLLLVLSAAAFSGLILAQPAGPSPGPPDPEKMLQRLTEKLDLSDQQQQDMAAAFASHRVAMQAGMQKMQAARQALDDQIHAATFDENAIRQASATVAGLEADGAVERGKLFQQIRGILTADQLQKFEQLRAEHRQKMQQWRQGDGPGPHGPHHRTY